jgi:hypothetical protein
MDDYQAELHETLEGSGGLRLRVPAGDIRVVGRDDDRISLDAVKKVRAVDEGEGRRFLERMQIKRRRDGDDWLIEASWPQPHPHGIQSAHVSFEVLVPGGTRLEARSGHGRIEAIGVDEALLSTGSGDVQAHEIAGTLNARTGHGAMQISGSKGPVDAESRSGDIRIGQAAGAVKAMTGHGALQMEQCAGPVEAESRSGGVRVREVAGSLEARSGHGRIEVTQAAAARLHTSSGDVHARGVGGRLEAFTGHGSIQNRKTTHSTPAQGFHRARAH